MHRSVGTRHGWTPERLISPMPLVFSAFGNPSADGFLLRLRQILVNRYRRHLPRGIGFENPANDEALVRIARDDGSAVTARCGRLVAQVETHTGHPRAGIRPVTAEARARHDRPDVPVESNAVRRLRCGSGRADGS